MFKRIKKRLSLREIIVPLLVILFIIFLIYIINMECPFLKYLHIYCAGRGTMRMFEALIHLKIYQAFRFNPLMFILFILLIIYLIYAIYTYIKKKVIIIPSKKLIIILAILLIIYTVLRNIPMFSYLIPTII